ncbi:MAG: VOC family protein [Solirubrobacteraceae bacterium]|nr:VOC family protein [Solirubrobacteraceae bacterium]
MIKDLAYMAFDVPDLDRSIEFAQSIMGLQVTEVQGATAYLSSNQRHHELVLTQTGERTSYAAIGLEVEHPSVLDSAPARLEAAGGRIELSTAPEEQFAERTLTVVGPGGHRFRLFCGMPERGDVKPSETGVPPSQLEHATVNVSNQPAFERFLRRGLGFRFSDRILPFASFWHCNHDHHGIACFWRPRTNGLNHFAWTITEEQLPQVAPLLAERGQELAWGPGHHPAGDNRFIYFFDGAGVLIEYNWGLGVMPPVGDYRPRTRVLGPRAMDYHGTFPPKHHRNANTPPSAHGSLADR